MLKLLLAQTALPATGNIAKYLLDFADEANADVTLLKPPPGKVKHGIIPPFSGRFSCNNVRQAVEASRHFSYDLILAGREQKREWFRKSPATHIAQIAWSPVMIIPAKAEFRPFSNILFLDSRLAASNQPIFQQFRVLWPQHCLLYPGRGTRSCMGGYYARRFDETGYAAFPRINIRCLQQYIQRHQVDLVVSGHGSHGISLGVLGELPVPVLALNSRNTAASRPRPGGTAAHVPGIAFMGRKKIR